MILIKLQWSEQKERLLAMKPHYGYNLNNYYAGALFRLHIDWIINKAWENNWKIASSAILNFVNNSCCITRNNNFGYDRKENYVNGHLLRGSKGNRLDMQIWRYDIKVKIILTFVNYAEDSKVRRLKLLNKIIHSFWITVCDTKTQTQNASGGIYRDRRIPNTERKLNTFPSRRKLEAETRG